MLKDHDSSAIVAVSDLGRARDFYSNVLGLELVEKGAEEGLLVYRTGATAVLSTGTYLSPSARRHPGLDPGPTFPSLAPEDRWTPDQVRGDGVDAR